MDGKPGGLSAASIKKHHNILSSMFSFAVLMGELEENPFLRVKPPKIPRRKPVSLEKGMTKELLLALVDEPLKYRAITLIAACTGMRRGEILAIGNATLDLEQCTIRINRASRHTSGGEVFLNDTKTESSERMIPFPESLVPLLMEQMEARNKQREICGNQWVSQMKLHDKIVENDLIFTQWNGKPMHPNSVDTWFRKFKSEHGFPDTLKFHGLRHANITLLLKMGVDVGTVADNAGHANKSMTLAYDDPSPTALREVAQKIETALDLKNTISSLLDQPKNIRRKRNTATE